MKMAITIEKRERKGFLKRDVLKTRLYFAKWCKKVFLRIFGLSIFRSFWTKLHFPTNEIPGPGASSRNKEEDMDKDIRGTCLGLCIQGTKRRNWRQSVKTHGSHQVYVKV